MSKAIEGAALLGGAIAIGVTEFALASTGIGIAALPFLTDAMMATAAAGVAMEAGAIASAITGNRGMNITTRQPAANRQIIYGMQRVGGVSVYQSTTGSKQDQYNYAICIAGHECWGIEALYLDGRKVNWQGANPAHPSAYYLPSPLGGIYFGGESDGGSYEGPDGHQYTFDGLVTAAAYYGDQTAADLCAGFTANDPLWNTTISGTPYLGGCTWIYLKLEYDPNEFPSSPEIRLTMYGKPVFDPRNGETTYSSNAALICADWISDAVNGLGIPVNQEQLIAAANVCDEQITLAGGGTEAQFACHHHFDSGSAPSDVLATLLKSMLGRVSFIGGEAYLWPAYWQGPSANLDESSLTAPVQWDSTAAYKDNINRVNGTYTAPNYPYNIAGNAYDKNGFDSDGNAQNNFQFGFQPTSFPQYACDPLHGYAADQYLNEDSGVSAAWAAGTTFALGQVVSYETTVAVSPSISANYVSIYKSLIANNLNNTPGPTSTAWQLASVILPMEANYNMVLSIAQAQRLAKIDLLRRRFWGRGSLEVGLSALSLQETDVINFTFPQNGWTEKALEITNTTFKTITRESQPGQPPTPPEFRVVFDVAETDPSIYEWDPVEELSIYDVPLLTTSNRVTAPPTDLTLISGLSTAVVGVDGSVSPRIEVTWETPLDGLVTQIEIQYQLVSNGIWQTAGYVSVDLNNFFIGPVVAGQIYSVQIRSIRANGATSAWVGPLSITAGLVLSVVSQVGVGIGSLTASAFANGYAEIECRPFTAYIASLTRSIFPGGPVTLTLDGTIGAAAGTLIKQQTIYYVYYVDPTCAGGNVTPIATTNLSDFTGKQGYYLIDSIATPYTSTSGNSFQYEPSHYIDTGSRTTVNPTFAYDSNLSTAAVVSSNATASYVGGTTKTTNAQGVCTWNGFPSFIAAAPMTLTVSLSTTDVLTGGATIGSATVTALIGGVLVTMGTINTSEATTSLTATIPQGTNLGTISVQVATAAGTLGTVNSGNTSSSATFSVLVYEIYAIGAQPYTLTPVGYPAPIDVTISQTSSTSESGSLVNSSGQLYAVFNVIVTVSWVFPSSYAPPSSFNVVLFEGNDPTNAANYIAPIAVAVGTARSYIFTIAPTSSMTDVNAAVEAVYA